MATAKFSRVAGRRAIYEPNHPKANNRGYVLYARWLVEQSIGRYLAEEEEVHHRNSDKDDDRLENLEVLLTADHASRHAVDRRRLDYDLVERLRRKGYGYKRIARETGYARSSIQSACKLIGSRA